MFKRRKQTKQQKKLSKLIKKYVKQGYRVETSGADHVSLYKPSMSFAGRGQRLATELMTMGLVGGNRQPDRHKTVFIRVDESGHADVIKGTAKI